MYKGFDTAKATVWFASHAIIFVTLALAFDVEEVTAALISGGIVLSTIIIMETIRRFRRM